MKEEYLDNIVVDGLDETYATNMDVDDVVSPSVMLVDFAIDGSSSMNPYEKTMQDCLATLYQLTGDDRFRPVPALDEHVANGELGRKTGKGWYDYTK